VKCSDYINSIKSAFNSLGVSDVLIKDGTLIIPIEKEDIMPSYKIAVTMIEEGYLSIYTSFKHSAVLKKELVELLKVVNTFNEQSFLKFIVKNKFIKVEYNMPELNIEDIDKVISIITIIPNILFDFYKDLKQYLS